MAVSQPENSVYSIIYFMIGPYDPLYFEFISLCHNPTWKRTINDKARKPSFE